MIDAVGPTMPLLNSISARIWNKNLGTASTISRRLLRSNKSGENSINESDMIARAKLGVWKELKVKAFDWHF